MSDRKLVDLQLVDKPTGELNRQAVHYVTDGVCHRPDLYFKGGKACDYCGLFQWCKASVKRLKDPGTQTADKNAGYFAAIEAANKPLPKATEKRIRFVAAGHKAKQLVKGKSKKAVKIVVAKAKVKVVAPKPKSKVLIKLKRK